MKNFYLFICTISLPIFSMDLTGLQELNNWKLLQKDPVQVEYQMYLGFPFSKSEIILNHSIQSISKTIQDLDKYPQIFDRVSDALRLDHNVVQIILDMPSINRTRRKENGELRNTTPSTISPNINSQSNISNNSIEDEPLIGGIVTKASPVSSSSTMNGDDIAYVNKRPATTFDGRCSDCNFTCSFYIYLF